MFFKKKEPNKSIRLNEIYSKLKEKYSFDNISDDRKNELSSLIGKFGYLPYPYIKALEELSYEEILFGLEIKWQANGIFEDSEFKFTNDKISVLARNGVNNSSWIQKEGHDINVTLDYMKKDLGEDLGSKIEKAALEIYKKCYDHAYKNGIIIADTKFEFGLDEGGNLVLADELLTPDSSRFWNLAEYKVGTSPASYDKQFVRDWLTANNLAGDANIKSIPEDIVKKTSALYKECQNRICK